jgi:transglutaminase-like putative cysteine protease
MRLLVDHRTTYRFTAPQARVVQLLRMTPGDTHDQTVADWHIAVDCDARMRDHRDGFGNATTMLYIEGPVDQVEISVSGAVVTSRSGGRLNGAAEPLPPATYLRITPATAPGEAIRALARDVEGHGDDSLATLQRLNLAIRDRFTLDRGKPAPGVTAEQAMTRGSATARDLAQVFVAASRVLAVPARYVTGYCELHDDHRPTPHGWAEAWLEGIGWIGFDPTLGASPEEHHVRVAVALDAAGSSPIAGFRLGEGDERLDVDVSVNAEG